MSERFLVVNIYGAFLLGLLEATQGDQSAQGVNSSTSRAGPEGD